MRQLERELGVELLERTTREVRLTAAGAALLEHGPRPRSPPPTPRSPPRPRVGRGLSGTRARRHVARPSGAPRSTRSRAAARRRARPVAVSLLEVRPATSSGCCATATLDLVIARTASARPGGRLRGAAADARRRWRSPADHRARGRRRGRPGAARRRAAAHVEPARDAVHRPAGRAARGGGRARRARRGARHGDQALTELAAPGPSRWCRRAGPRATAPCCWRSATTSRCRSSCSGPWARSRRRCGGCARRSSGVRGSAPRRRVGAPLVIRARSVDDWGA